MESGTVVVGSPRTVRDQLARLRDATSAGKLVTMLQFGVLSDELTRRNMEMFRSEVMPHLRDWCTRSGLDLHLRGESAFV